MSTKWSAGATALLLATSVTAAASDSQQTSMRFLDANNDGLISEQEASENRTMSESFDDMDRDGGKLTPTTKVTTTATRRWVMNDGNPAVLLTHQ